MQNLELIKILLDCISLQEKTPLATLAIDKESITPIQENIYKASSVPKIAVDHFLEDYHIQTKITPRKNEANLKIEGKGIGYDSMLDCVVARNLTIASRFGIIHDKMVLQSRVETITFKYPKQMPIRFLREEETTLFDVPMNSKIENGFQEVPPLYQPQYTKRNGEH